MGVEKQVAAGTFRAVRKMPLHFCYTFLVSPCIQEIFSRYPSESLKLFGLCPQPLSLLEFHQI
jgi:hypothetical protein